VQCLDLALLVHAQNHRLLGLIEVEPDDVADLGLQLRPGRELERLAPPGLHPVLALGAGDGRVGQVTVGEGFREVENAWTACVAAMARAGSHHHRRRVPQRSRVTGNTRTHLAGLKVLWVGVRCDPAIARGGRVTGMAASQAEIVHQGVVYDLEVDTSHTESLDCARTIAARVVG
jgi:chloramphenicol 3-O phosphotransferase